MKAYILTTGTVFGLMVVVHVWRFVVEGASLAKDAPWLLITAFAGALCVWAFGLLWRTRGV